MWKSLFRLLLFALGVFAFWIALTSLAPGSWIAEWAPCPRNWAWADAWLPRKSPLDATAFSFGEVKGKVCYGRPSLRGRKMIGGDAIPFGQLWRTGANEPTTLHLDAPARLGPVQLLAGSYSIYTVPGETKWEFVVNRATRQWGLESEYTEAIRRLEIGRFEVHAEKLDDSVETFTIHATPIATGAVELVFEWETTRLRVPLVEGFANENDKVDTSPPRPDVE